MSTSESLWVGVITLFPPMMEALSWGITGRAIQRGLLTVETFNPREFSPNKHKTVDDRPYGGGPGMVMMVEPIQKAVKAAREKAPTQAKVIYLTPQGSKLNQQAVGQFAKTSSLILIAGRYEGIDERLMNVCVEEEWSIGDYVLSGGELAAMVMIDAITRQLPGALGDADSASEDSFMAGLLDYPHYTRPEDFEGHKVPEVLLSGDHQAILRWRRKMALGRTWQRHPHLLADRDLSTEEANLLTEFREENDHE